MDQHGIQAISPRDVAAEKLIHSLPSQWTDLSGELSATERDVLGRFVEVGLAQCKVDILLTWKPRLLPWKRTAHFLYRVSGFKWRDNVERAAFRDAGFDVIRGEKPESIFGPEILQFQLTSDGETARHFCESNGPANLTTFLKIANPEFSCHRLAWDRREKSAVRDVQATAIAQNINNIQVNVPAPVVNVTLPEITMPQVVVNVSASGTAAPVDNSPPLEVTLNQMSWLVGGKPTEANMNKNKEGRPDPVFAEAGKRSRWKYSVLAAWVKQVWPDTFPPTEVDARKELSARPTV